MIKVICYVFCKSMSERTLKYFYFKMCSRTSTENIWKFWKNNPNSLARFNFRACSGGAIFQEETSRGIAGPETKGNIAVDG